MSLIDPIALLERTDKWYLGNGGMLLYAPPFPTNLRVPGFWDDCHYGDLAVPRLLCVSFVGETPAGMIPLEAHLNHWRWWPDRIEARHYLVERDGLGYKQQRGVRIFVNETRRLSHDGTLHCDLSFDTLAGVELKALHVVAWTARRRDDATEPGDFRDPNGDGRALAYREKLSRRVHGRGEASVEVAVSMQGSRKPTSLQVMPSHGANLVPQLEYTPMWDALRSQRRLSGEVVGENVLGSVIYAGLHWRLPVKDNQLRPLRIQAKVGEPQRAKLSRRQAKSAELQFAKQPTQDWRSFLKRVPHFECSDEMLNRYYWYRWYGLWLNAVPEGGNYVAPAVCEGIAYFRGVVTYSLMCHLNELKWLKDAELAQGCLRNHIACQTKAGHFPGHIYLAHVNKDGFYHTDVGRSVAALLDHHPDAAFAAEVYAPLKKLLNFYLRDRDEEGLGLFDVRDQFETGQEFTSRYFHADKQADSYGWEHKLKLKGVDVTCYVFHLVGLLIRLVPLVGRQRELKQLLRLQAKIKQAVQDLHWNKRRGWFTDYSAQKQQRSPYLAAMGSYPALSDLATPAQRKAVAAQLADSAKFATPWPTPTVPIDDPYFSSDPTWRDERANCPWNGRSWPMVNSHVVEVLGSLAEDDASGRPALVAFLRRYVEMLHFESSAGGKDLTRPNCFEHYNPQTGSACEYRGIDDYMHSWVSDLILKYVAGVRIASGKLVVDPYPFGLSQFLLGDCRLAGHRLDVCLNRSRAGGKAAGFRIYLDGKLAHRSTELERWEVEL